MRIAICGGTGFVGQHLTKELVSQGHEVVILTRNVANKKHLPNVSYIAWDDENIVEKLNNSYGIINLAGESLNSGRWTKKRKKVLIQSRIYTTKNVYTLINKLTNKPSIFINASAIGFYGTSLSKSFTESELSFGDDFLAQTVVAWEEEAKKVEALGIRTVYARFGVILGNNGGAFPKMITPYKFYIGGRIGNGQQWLSWVHIKDAINLMIFTLNNSNISGPLNITAPTPVTMEHFGAEVALLLRKPHWMPVPSFALKSLLGEMSMLLLQGQRVFPEKAINSGFHFKYKTINDALSNLILEEKNNGNE